MSVSSIGTQILMSKEEHKDVNTPPAEDALVNASLDIRDASITGGAVEDLDRTGLGHTAREFIAGLKDSGTASMSVFYESKKDSAYRELMRASKDRKNRYIKIIYENGDTCEFVGYVNQFDRPLTVGELIVNEVGFKLSGDTVDKFIDPDTARGEEAPSK